MNNLNIISKLDFKNTNVGNLTSLQDNNKYSNITWSGLNTPKIIEENNNKILKIDSNAARLESPVLYTGTSFSMNNFQVEFDIEFLSLKSENGYFGFTNSKAKWMAFYVRRGIKKGLIVTLSGIEISCNYLFESNKRYNIIVTRKDDIYSFLINGEIIGYTSSSEFSSKITSVNLTCTVGSAGNSGDVTYIDNAKIYGFNLSIGPTAKYDTQFTKYGSNLISKLNFSNIMLSSVSSSYTCGLESVINSSAVWEYTLVDPLFNKDMIINNTSYKTVLDNNFTIVSSMYNTNKSETINLVNINDKYKVLYTLIKTGAPEPEVVVNEYTTSALDFENEIVDKVATTVWSKEGTADVTQNKIFGNASFETKALGDSLSTNSKILSGGSVPFTIESYYLFDPDFSTTQQDTDLSIFSQSGDTGYYQGYFLSRSTMMIGTYRHTSFTKPITDDTFNKKTKLKPNEVNKITVSYDGSALRSFINDELDGIYGTSAGIELTNQPFRLLSYNYNTNKNTTKGIIDNINIFDGIATKVRDNDPYEENLVVDLAFDGENNSTKIVDNATKVLEPKPFIQSLLRFDSLNDDIDNNIWNLSGDAKLTSNEKKFGSYSLESSTGGITSIESSTFNIGTLDYTIEFYYKPKSLDNWRTPFQKGVWNSSNGLTFIVGYSTMKVCTNGVDSGEMKHDLLLNQWNHIAITRNSNICKIFINGLLKGTFNQSQNISSNYPIQLMVGGGIVGPANGYIDQFIYMVGVCAYTSDFALNQNKYNYEKIYLKNQWTINGNAKISTEQKFDGFSSLYSDISSYMYTNKNLNISTNDSFTISFDFLFNSFNSSTFNAIFTNNHPETTYRFQCCYTTYNNYNTIVIGYSNDKNESIYNYLIKTKIETNKRYKINLVFTENMMLVYVNNILDGIDMLRTLQNHHDNLFDKGLVIGGFAWNYSNNGLNGYIKNFKIYKGVAIIPESLNGKIQLDFDNNLNDKYNNSTWTNNGVTFDQVNSVKGYAGYFANGNKYIETTSETFNYKYNDFSLKWDMKASSGRVSYDELFASQQSSWVNGCSAISCFRDGQVRIASYYNNVDTSFGNCWVKNDNYYNVNFNRTNDVMHVYLNDVITSSSILSTRYSGVLPQFNFNKIGKGLWSGNNVGYRGYIDNVKSYKEDLVNLNTRYLHTDSIFSKEVKNENLILKYSSITNPVKYFTVLFDDSPSLKDFICEVDVFIPTSVYQQCRIAFRTSNFDYAEDERLGYTAYIADDYIMFGRGGNGSSSWNNEQRTSLIKYKDDSYHKFKVIANGSSIRIYIDNDLIFDLTDSTYNDVISKIALRGNGGYNIRSTMIKSFKISDLNNNELYYKDWKTKIENNITNTAVHLPLETNSNNIGFTPLTVNAVGTPTFAVVDNKKCIKFESGKYLTINNNNIFNFGQSSDFYIEIDIYPQLFHDTGYGHSILSNGVCEWSKCNVVTIFT